MIANGIDAPALWPGLPVRPVKGEVLRLRWRKGCMPLLQRVIRARLHGRQVFRFIVLPQAIANVFPALLSQVLIVMLGSAVVSQISVPDLTYAANFIQSRNFRSFESYLIITATYLVLSIVLRQILNRLGRGLFAGRAARGNESAPRNWRNRLMWRGARTLPTER